jgi:hypothetical protein
VYSSSSRTLERLSLNQVQIRCVGVFREARAYGSVNLDENTKYLPALSKVRRLYVIGEVCGKSKYKSDIRQLLLA